MKSKDDEEAFALRMPTPRWGTVIQGGGWAAHLSWWHEWRKVEEYSTLLEFPDEVSSIYITPTRTPIHRQTERQTVCPPLGWATWHQRNDAYFWKVACSDTHVRISNIASFKYESTRTIFYFFSNFWAEYSTQDWCLFVWRCKLRLGGSVIFLKPALSAS